MILPSESPVTMNALEAVEVRPFSETSRRVGRLYRASFPKDERIPLPFLHLLTILRKNARFLAFYDGEDLVGFAHVISDGELLFVLFLAVDPTARSQGYGSRILAALREAYPDHEMFLEIEPVGTDAPNEEQRVRRLAFYERNGLRRTGYQIHDGQWYDVLSTDVDLDPKRAEALVHMSTRNPVRSRRRP